jgi:hypothetical protein
MDNKDFKLTEVGQNICNTINGLLRLLAIGM